MRFDAQSTACSEKVSKLKGLNTVLQQLEKLQGVDEEMRQQSTSLPYGGVRTPSAKRWQ